MVYNLYIHMKKDKMFPMRMTKKEWAELKRLAAQEGHNSVAGFIMWLIRQFKDGKLVRK
jgi:hypothetical protein